MILRERRNDNLRKYQERVCRFAIDTYHGKALAAIILFLAMFFCVCFWSRAESVQVYDDAGMLAEEERSSLASEVTRVEELTGWDLVVLTADDASVSSPRDYAENKYNELSGADDGAALLLDMYNREIYLATAGEAITYLTDKRIEDILDDAYGYASDGEYAEMFQVMLEDIADYYDQGVVKNHRTYNEDTGTYTYTEQQVKRGITPVEAAVAGIAGAAACLIFCVIIIGRYRLKFNLYKYSPYEHGHMEVKRREDRLINQYVTRRKIPKNPPSNGGSTSTIHTGAGGRSFGGGGRKF